MVCDIAAAIAMYICQGDKHIYTYRGRNITYLNTSLQMSVITTGEENKNKPMYTCIVNKKQVINGQ